MFRFVQATLAAALIAQGPQLCQAQVRVDHVVAEGYSLSPASLFQATLTDQGAPITVVIEGSITTTSGAAVLDWKSRAFQLATGTRVVRSAELSWDRYEFGTDALGREAALRQRLPAGRYRFCLRVRAGSEGDDEWCDAVEMERFVLLDHVHPFDRDTVEERRPALTWTAAGDVQESADTHFRLSLFRMRPGQNAAQAVGSETPVFVLRDALPRFVPYPPAAPDLVPGAWYAWQVELVERDRVIERAEPWSFVVRKRVEPIPNKYVRLDAEKGGSIYEVVDGKIHFRYDEPYASTGLDCTILSAERKLIEPEVSGDAVEGSTVPGVRSVGVNLYELDLQPYGLRKGYYELVVKNEKGRSARLKFHVNR